jgi:hypothetical protein
VSTPPAYPVSTPPGYPVSSAPAFPASAVPGYPVALAGAPEPKKSPWGMVFGILSLVLLLATGGVGYLYYAERDKAGDHGTEVAGLRAQVEDLQDELDQSKEDLQNALDDAQDCSGYVQDFLDFVVEASKAGEEGLTDLDASQLGATFLGMIGACDVEFDMSQLAG